jgi:hypothetical protein
VLVDVAGRNGNLDSASVQQRLAKIPSVSRVTIRRSQENRSTLEVESGAKDGFIRGDIARAVVECGWDLNELRPAAVSLEEVFLQLTKAEEPSKIVAAQGRQS